MFSGKKALPVKALHNFSLEIMQGECLAVVGESGSGKTTLGRSLVRLVKPDSGQIYHNGLDILQMSEKQFRHLRPQLQIVFQNHGTAFNPRQTIGSCLSEVLQVHSSLTKAQTTRRVDELLDSVELGSSYHARFPHELSGGQRQRVAIARALATDPIFVVADEPTSSLDAATKSSILTLLRNLQANRGITLLLITHDLGVVSQIADRTAVLYKGELAELANVTSLLTSPAHPYTRLLVQAANLTPQKVYHQPGPSAQIQEPENACRFANRCPSVGAVCSSEKPHLRVINPDHTVACHLDGTNLVEDSESRCTAIVDR